jgi:hypothetical protein
MLLAHPRSRPMMFYAFHPDEARGVLAANPLSTEPFEFFPPDAAEMTGQERFLDAFRIVRRLRSESVTPDERDLEIAGRFVRSSGELDPDNAYWGQLLAAILGYADDAEAGAAAWKQAATAGRWETGEGEALRMLWNELAEADGQRLAWQGVVALDHTSEGPSHFIVSNVEPFALGDIVMRYTSLANAGIVLESSRSFSTASAAISLAELAVFGRKEPIEALGQRRYEQLKTEFPATVAQALGNDAGERARQDIQTVESWQAFYRSGDTQARAALARLRIESLLTASLPSSLFTASLLMLGLGLIGTLIATLLGPVLNPDRAVLLGLGVLTSIFLWWQSGIVLIGVWALTIAAVLSIPQMTARDAPIEWRTSERVAVMCVALLGMLLLAAWFVLESTPATYLNGKVFNARSLGSVAGLTLSLALPCAAVWARIRKVSIMRAVGETLRLVGLSGAFVGLAATIILGPIALWRDVANRTLLDQWVRNEPATFRPDAPQ